MFLFLFLFFWSILSASRGLVSLSFHLILLLLLLCFFYSFSSVFFSFLPSFVSVFHVTSSCFPLFAFLSFFLHSCCFMFFCEAVTSSFLLLLSLLRKNRSFVLYFLTVRLSIFLLLDRLYLLVHFFQVIFFLSFLIFFFCRFF